MANRQTHLDIAIGVAVVTVLASVREESPWTFLAEAAGVVAGCAAGGLLPDILEPGTSSWHRKTFHSVAVLGGTLSLTAKPPMALRTWRESLREQAESCRSRIEALPTGDPQRGDLWLSRMICHFLAGASVGLPLGYLSHLLKDAQSPRGLPLI